MLSLPRWAVNIPIVMSSEAIIVTASIVIKVIVTSIITWLRIIAVSNVSLTVIGTISAIIITSAAVIISNVSWTEIGIISAIVIISLSIHVIYLQRISAF